MAESNIVCPKCNGSVHKKGIKPGGKQCYCCNECNYRTVSPLSVNGDIADGYVVKGQSTLYDKDGSVKLQWQKTDRSSELQLKMLKATVDAMCEDLPKALPVQLKEKTNSNMLNQITLTDYHVGMMAWHEEGGADWDLKISEDLLYKAFKSLIHRMPEAETCVIAQLGDFLHFDGIISVTQSGHVLDSDSRFTKIIRVAIRMLRTIINLALLKHKYVHVVCAEGNHDQASSKWLSNMLDVFYDDEPRLTVDTSALPYYAYQHGKTSLYYHHGHKKNMAQAPLLMAAMFPKIWGSTEYRYYHCGHYHHQKTIESPGIICEQFQTLAAKDAYSSHGGYMAERAVHGISYHKQYGQVGRVIVKPEML